jgi:pimeloyl-ACP methyl ester carboxylesterase
MTATVARAGFEERFVDTDGFQMRYLEAGSGPPLVHLHSAGGLRISPAHEILASSNRVIAFEIPGYAAGCPNDRSQSMFELGTSIVKGVNALGLKRFNLWGTSFGGALAFWTAVASPTSIDALVLEAPGAIEPDGGFPPISTPEELHLYLYAHPERHPPAPPLDPALRNQRRALLERLTPAPREEVLQRMAELDVPTLVVFGTRDRLTPPELGRVYREHLKRSQLVLLYDAGHNAADERPEAFASLVNDFLVRREAFIVTDRSALLHP